MDNVYAIRKISDTNKAIRHLKAILVSYDPKHEHKEAGVAFLLSEWFEDVTYIRRTK